MAANTAPTQPDSGIVAQSRVPYEAFLWYGALLTLSFWSVVNAMVYQWQNDDDMSHGMFVPLIAGYAFWELREKWLSLPQARNPWGLVVIAWGAVQLWVATLGSELFLQRTAILVTLVGLILFYGGGAGLRLLRFPLFLLLFMVPIPGVFQKQITFPLQLLASRIGELVIEVFGYMVYREGNVLELAGQQLSVAEACSGIRSLFSLAFFGLTYAYLFDTRVWTRWYLLAASVPVALAVNALRIVVTAVVGEHNPELAQGVYHTASGWTLFVAGIVFMIGLWKLTTLRWWRREVSHV